MTENFSISDGKSLVKLDLGVAVEAMSMPQYDEQQKLTRLRCRLLDDSKKEGWVTMKGNQGGCICCLSHLFMVYCILAFTSCSLYIYGFIS